METQKQQISKVVPKPTPTPPSRPKPKPSPTPKPAAKKQTDVVGAHATPQPTPRPAPPPPPPKSKKNQILGKFKTKNWNKLRMTDLDFKKRKALCRELCQYISKSLGIKKVPKIVYSDGEEGECGGYNYTTNTIEINKIYFYDPPENIVNTIAHETRHAYQYQRAKIGATALDRKWMDNFNNYKSAKKYGYKIYRNQPLEVDAFNYGDQYGKYFVKNIDK
jgi:hypothetical protein